MIKHKTGVIDLLFFRRRGDKVTCSGMVGLCAKEQANSKLAKALEKARSKGEFWGELTPNDLGDVFRLMDADDAAQTGPPQ